MANQARIINATNKLLKQKSKIDFELNKAGVCAGLAALFVKYSLENKSQQFFHLIERLSSLPSTYRLGDNAAIDNFIIQIEHAYRPFEYTQYRVKQGELEKMLFIGDKPLRHEFSLGLTTDEASWEDILKQISYNDRSYFIGSSKHAIAFTYKNGKYQLYDPNYTINFAEFDSAASLLKEIKHCFEYEGTTFGLNIRAYANPNEPVCLQYPSHRQLHQIAFAKDVDATSIFYAAEASDKETIEYLFTNNKIQHDLIVKEFLHEEFNDVLIRQAKSNSIRNLLLTAIKVQIIIGNQTELERFIKHYCAVYNQKNDKTDLQEIIRDLLTKPIINNLDMMKNKSNYSYLLSLVQQFNLDKDAQCETNYTFLQLVNLQTNTTNPVAIGQFLQKLSSAQILNQIYCAAITNQQQLLTLLMKAPIDHKLHPSIIDKDLLQKINAVTLKKLLDSGFALNLKDESLFKVCLQRKDKTILALYAEACLKQSNQYPIWQNIEKYNHSAINLTANLGSFSLLEMLIVMQKNEFIKKAWKNTIPEEVLKNSLIIAIANGNKQMSEFFYQELKKQGSDLEPDTYEYFYKQALQDGDLSSLQLLTRLNYNVLHSMQDIIKILNIAYDNDEYSIIEHWFDRASTKMKMLILKQSILWKMPKIVTLFIEKNQIALLNAYFNEAIGSLDKLAHLNKMLKLLPPDTIICNTPIASRKNLIKECYKRKLFTLAKILGQQVVWEDAELKLFLHELMQDKNEQGIMALLLISPKLSASIKKYLIENNMLSAIELLLSQGLILEKQEIAQLLSQRPGSALFEDIYAQGLGRLYQVVLQMNIENPKAALLRSIKQPQNDPKFKTTERYLAPMKKALKEQNHRLFNTLFDANTLPINLDQKMIGFLDDPIVFDGLFHLFNKKYGINVLIIDALKYKEWEVLGNLLEKCQFTDLPLDIQNAITVKKDLIITAYIENLANHYDKIDVRPKLFALFTNELASTYTELLHNQLKTIELKMIKQKMDLNYQVYRHEIELEPFYKNQEMHFPDHRKSNQMNDKLQLLKEKCTSALNHYLKHRDKTLSFFSYFFDYYRGKIRAEHYKKLINAAQTERELYVIEYALIHNKNGRQLKQDFAQEFQYQDKASAELGIKNKMLELCSTDEVDQLETVVDSINQKINHTKSNLTQSLFKEEICFIRKTPLVGGSFFKHKPLQPECSNVIPNHPSRDR